MQSFQHGRRAALQPPCSRLGLARRPPAFAQAWPAKPVRVDRQLPAGRRGRPDRARRLAAAAEALGQPVVVENRAGANGNIAGEWWPSAGRRLHPAHELGRHGVDQPAPVPKMAFDPAKDLTPVAAAARVLVFLEVSPKVPVNTPGIPGLPQGQSGQAVSFGSPGNGSSPHLAAEMMKAQTGVFATHIPYRGAAPAMQDLLAGQIDFMFDPGIGLQQVKAGKLKLLAVGSPQALAAVPRRADHGRGRPEGLRRRHLVRLLCAGRQRRRPSSRG